MLAVGGVVAIIVIAKWTEEDNTSGIFIAKERECAVGFLFEIAEVDDVAAVLYGVENAVSAAIRLQKTVHFEILIDPKSVERFGVEASEEHPDNDNHVELTILDALRNIFVITLEIVAIERVLSAEHAIIIVDSTA